MNRTIIRLFGFFITMIGILPHGTYAATSTPVGPAEECPDQPTPVVPSDCIFKGSDAISGVAKYNSYTCPEDLGAGYVSYSEDLISMYPECSSTGSGTGNGIAQFSPCYGWCNPTGIVCPGQHDADLFFQTSNCSPAPASSSSSCTYEYKENILSYPNHATDFYFAGCADGNYTTCGEYGSGTLLHTGYNADSLNNGAESFIYNCAPCSGLQVNGGNLETYPQSGTISNADFSWDSDAKYISSCRAYSKRPATINEGTFTITSEGCPYVN